MAKHAPISTWSTPRLRLATLTWAARLRHRRSALAKVSEIHTSNTPHTKITPEQKTALVSKWSLLVRGATRTHRLLEVELQRRTLTLGERALEEAEKLVGIREAGGNNRGAAVDALIREAGGVGPEPWCGDFVLVAYKRAGSSVVQRGWAAVRNLGFLTGMRILRSIRDGKPGDIVCYVFDHTGLLIRYCNEAGTPLPARIATHIVAREGNTGASGAVSDSAGGGDGSRDKIRPLNLVARIVRVDR